MSSQPTPTITVTDPQNNPLRLGETQLARELKDSQTKQERDSRQGKNTIKTESKPANVLQFLQLGVNYNGLIYPPAIDQWAGFTSTEPIDRLKLNNLSEFRLTVATNLVPRGFPDTSTLPTTKATIPVQFSILIYTIDDITGFQAKPLLGVNVGNLTVTTIGEILFTPFNNSVNLLDTISSQERGLTTPVFTTSNISKLTNTQLDYILNNGVQYVYGVFPELDTLTVSQKAFLDNNVFLMSFGVSTSFIYTGIRAVS